VRQLMETNVATQQSRGFHGGSHSLPPFRQTNFFFFFFFGIEVQETLANTY
jgi:hypothetical protein